jgi:hypothetical protein
MQMCVQMQQGQVYAYLCAYSIQTTSMLQKCTFFKMLCENSTQMGHNNGTHTENTYHSPINQSPYLST